jgi:hypothetical protein
MNDPFLVKLRESAEWLLLDPVTPQHLAVAGGLCLVLGILVFRSVVKNLGASNWTLPMAVVSFVLGLGAMIAGLTAADMFLLPMVPKSVPFPAYAGGVLLLVLLAVAAPIGKFLMKCGYAATASAWVTSLLVCAAVVFLADSGFTNFGPQMARVLDMKGAVSYRLAKGEPQAEIKKRRMGLPVGAEITTKADASATLDLGAKGFIAIRPLSVVRIRAVGEQATIEVDVGRIIGSVRHTAKTKFQIRTPAANTGIVGTDFMVDSDSAKQTFVTVATGKVAVANANGGATVEVGAGQTVNCPNGGAPTQPRPANPDDLKTINSFKAAVGDTMNQRNKQIEDAL